MSSSKIEIVRDAAVITKTTTKATPEIQQRSPGFVGRGPRATAEAAPPLSGFCPRYRALTIEEQEIRDLTGNNRDPWVCELSWVK